MMAVLLLVEAGLTRRVILEALKVLPLGLLHIFLKLFIFMILVIECKLLPSEILDELPLFVNLLLDQVNLILLL
jgi:hypothetical protein